MNDISVPQQYDLETAALKVPPHSIEAEQAVLGGLMQDSLENSSAGLPGVSRVRGLGNLFSYKSESAVKTELIVFIRPVVIKQPSLDGDFEDYREFLPSEGLASDGLFTSQFNDAALR